MAYSKRVVLAVMFSVTILVASLAVWLSQEKGEQGVTEAQSSCLTGSQGIVEFRLVPYARVYDVTNGEIAPEFLFESHYEVLRLDRGVYHFRFDYGNRTSWKQVRVARTQKCMVTVDLRF